MVAQGCPDGPCATIGDPATCNSNPHCQWGAGPPPGGTPPGGTPPGARRQLSEVLDALFDFAPELEVQIKLTQRNLRELSTMCELQDQLDAKRHEEVARLEEELDQTRLEAEAATRQPARAL